MDVRQNIKPHKELLYISYTPIYNTTVVYYGNKSSVIEVLRAFDIWNSSGLYDPNDGFSIMDGPYRKSGSWKFECSKEFYMFALSDNFARACEKMNISLFVYKVNMGAFV